MSVEFIVTKCSTQRRRWRPSLSRPQGNRTFNFLDAPRSPVIPAHAGIQSGVAGDTRLLPITPDVA